MCLGVPGKIIEINGTKGKVDIFGVERGINLGLVENPKIGDYVLMHAGYAVQIIDIGQAEETINIFKELQDAFEDSES